MARQISQAWLAFMIVIIGFQDVAAGVAGSIMANIIQAFPDFSPTIVMMVATFPGFLSIVTALLYGKLSQVIRKKTLLIIGLILFIIGGTMPTFLDSLPLIIVMRGILGLGVGLTVPLSVDLLNDFFEGKKRDFLLGLSNSTVACIGAIFFQLVGGMLADAYDWHYGFLTYLFPIWILAIVAIWLPEPPKNLPAKDEPAKVKTRIPGAVYWITLAQVVFSAFLFGYVTNISVVIQNDQLGNATEAGLAISVFTLGTLISGLFFGIFKNALPRSNMPIAFLITGIGMAMCYYSPTLELIFAGSLVAGIGMGFGLTGMFAKMTEAAPLAVVSLGLGLVVVGQGLGGIVGPFAYQAIQNVFNQTIGRFPLAISAVGLVLLCIVWALTATRSSKSIGVSNSQ